jgi:hypothetical protein
LAPLLFVSVFPSRSRSFLLALGLPFPVLSTSLGSAPRVAEGPALSTSFSLGPAFIVSDASPQAVFRPFRGAWLFLLFFLKRNRQVGKGREKRTQKARRNLPSTQLGEDGRSGQDSWKMGP